MVTHEFVEIRPKTKCRCCDVHVGPGTNAVLVVHLPQARVDTLCPECWTTTLAAALLGMREHLDLTKEGFGKLLQEAVEHLSAENDS